MVSEDVLAMSSLAQLVLTANKGVKEHALGYPLGASIEDPKAVNGRLNKAKHVRDSLCQVFAGPSLTDCRSD